MLDDEAVLIDAPAGATLLGTAVTCHELDRLRRERTAPAWSRVAVRLDDDGYDRDELADTLRRRLPGVTVMDGLHAPLHGRTWELDVLPLHGRPFVLLGPRKGT
jgi:hypothetical protein